MGQKEIKPEKLPEKERFIEWYNKVLELAEIAERRYAVKGAFVWMPYGLKIMKALVHWWDTEFQKNGIEETYFPLFVPLQYAKQNDSWFEGFKENLYVAKPYAAKDTETLFLRPTGEPAMYPIFRLWIRDGKLPIKVYETVSSFRFEGRTTHTMIRDREITFWYEIHTVHKTREEAMEEMEKHIEINDRLWKEMLNIKPIKVEKPKYELFPGADSAVEYYTILPDGRLLENGSVNNLGQAYAKKFKLQYVDGEGKKHYCWQICTGNGARYLVAVFAIHGDERGLVLPPRIAPLQVVIIPILKKGSEERIKQACEELARVLREQNIRAECDFSEESTGAKFYKWDIKGVPLRIEVGLRELEENKVTVFRRDTKERVIIEKRKLVSFVKQLLEEELPKTLLERSEKFVEEKVKYFSNVEEALEWIKKGGVAKLHWCEGKECYEKLCSLIEAAEPTGSLLDESSKGKCVICGKKTEKLTLYGRTY